MNIIELSDKATKLVQDNLYWGNNSADQLDLIWAELRAALPKPLKAGDRVLRKDGHFGPRTIIAIDGDYAWVKHDGDEGHSTNRLDGLELA